MTPRQILLIALLVLVTVGGYFFSTRPNPEAEITKLFEAANNAAQADNQTEAIDLYTQALELTPKDPKDKATLYLNRGRAYYKTGKIELGIVDFNQSIELNPQEASAYYGRGSLYLTQKKIDLAAADYKKVLEIEPANGPANNGLGVIYLNQGKYVEALPLLIKALETAGAENKYMYHANLGFSYFRTNQLKEASLHVEQAIQLNPKFPNSYFVRAGIAAKANDCPKAETDLKMSCQLGFKPACNANCQKLKK